MLEMSSYKRRTSNHTKLFSEKYQKTIKLNDGTKVLFRSLTSADIPRWKIFIKKCSLDSLYSRFQGIITGIEDQGNEFCQTNHKNTISIAAEIEHGGQKELIAVARLMRDKKHDQAEFAILVRDDWQHKGIGNELTNFCQNIAMKFGINVLIALTTVDNYRMILILQKNGFFINYRDIFPFIEFRKSLLKYKEKNISFRVQEKNFCSL